MTATRLLVLGTRNPKKVEEMVPLLAPHGFQLQTLADMVHGLEVAETGHSFAENAQLKATVQAQHLKQWVVGEDSGLCVDALDGAPGVYSARYSGPEATDQTNNEKLLSLLADVPLERRTAHYVCHMALSDPQGNVRVSCEERCHGRILFFPAGNGGFGYDPLFEVVECHRTFAQLGLHVKGLLSHRGRAIRKFVPQLLQLTSIGQWPVVVH